jgi:diguanylate cyclase (GGDEF)-like protein
MGSKQKPQAIITVEAKNYASNHDLMLQILAIYHNFMSLIHDNEHDTLTGLLNRKTFNLKINDIITSLQSHSHVHSKANNESNAYLAIFDLDHFKRVNDTHGHLLGDEILLLFSQQMHKNFRDKDLLFRFGGEEFIGIFQCSDDDTITHILSRFRETIAQFNFPQVGQITASCGFTKIGAFDLSSNTIDRADLSLYHAKHNGRNQICQYEQLIASGALEEKKSSSGDIELF